MRGFKMEGFELSWEYVQTTYLIVLGHSVFAICVLEVKLAMLSTKELTNTSK